MPSGGSTDIFSSYVSTTCYAHTMSTHASRVGQQAPRNGNVHSAILTYGSGCGSQPNYREYLQVLLTTPLTTGQDYDIEFWVSLGDRSNTASNNFGVRFNTGFTYTTSCFVLNQTPQFNHTGVITNKTGWTRVSGTITAAAAWRYIIIGNFFSNAATATSSVGGDFSNTRYFLDDVSVAPAVILPASGLVLNGDRKKDGLIDLQWTLPGDEASEMFSVQRSGDGMTWETMSDVAVGHEKALLAWTDHFPPAGELMYRVRYTDKDGKHYSSNVVRFSGENTFPYRLQIANHPAPAEQPIRLRIGQADDAQASVEVHDMTGRLIWAKSGMTMRELDGFEIPAGLLSPNMYVIRLATNRGHLSRKLVVR